MPLTDNQIERYSRQIIVPGVGGRAQERLLESCAAIVGEPADAASALAYLAGAGVGQIVMHPVGDRALYAAIVERMRDLNPDVRVKIANNEMPTQCDLILALVGGASAAEAAARLWDAPHAGAPGAPETRYGAAIVARLDMPGRIALMPAPPPCPLCAEIDLLSTPGTRAANSGVVLMFAVAEAFKLLAGYAGQQLEATLIEFDGYAARARGFARRRPGGGEQTRCACEAAA